LPSKTTVSTVSSAKADRVTKLGQLHARNAI
jgi:hypothetical protein